MSDANQAIIEEKRLRQPQPTPAVVPDSTEDWESGISFFAHPQANLFSVVGDILNTG